MHQLTSRIRAGNGRTEDIDRLLAICPDMLGRTVCVLADSAAIPAASYIKKFRHEFEAYIDKANPPERKLQPGGVNLEAGAM
jgi:NADH-quinone oxidoreductase subunit F